MSPAFSIMEPNNGGQGLSSFLDYKESFCALFKIFFKGGKGNHSNLFFKT